MTGKSNETFGGITNPYSSRNRLTRSSMAREINSPVDSFPRQEPTVHGNATCAAAMAPLITEAVVQSDGWRRCAGVTFRFFAILAACVINL